MSHKIQKYKHFMGINNLMVISHSKFHFGGLQDQCFGLVNFEIQAPFVSLIYPFKLG